MRDVEICCYWKFIDLSYLTGMWVHLVVAPMVYRGADCHEC